MTDVTLRTDMQRRVYALFNGVDNDVLIEDIFIAAHPGRDVERYDNRDMQQDLSPLFGRMNTLLAPARIKIVPGQLKKTYRLTRIVE